MATPPQGYLKLIAVVKRKCPGLSFKEATAIIVRVKKMNGGVLKGLKMVEFIEFVGKAVKEHNNEEKHNEKEDRRKESERNKTCHICFVVFSKTQARERHMMVHKKRDEPIIADEVPSTIDDAFPDIDENVVGLDEQKEAGGHILMDFKCEECGKTFRHQVSLKKHLRDHDNVKTIICNMCDLKFKRMDNLYAHKRMVHNAHKINCDVLRNEAERSLSCKMCGVSFENWKKFEAHIVHKVCKSNVEISEDGEERYQCEFCDRSYKHKKSLFAHLEWKHKSKKSYKWEKCDVMYTHNSSLVRHMKKLH